MPRPRVPRKLKLIRGTFRPGENPANEPEPEVLSDVPKAPSYLNRWGKAKWKEIAEELVDKGVLTVVDLPALELLCAQYGLFCELHDAITHEVGPDGKRRKVSVARYLAGKNSQTIPEYVQMKAASAAYKTYAVEFGLTPASRNRIDLPERTPQTKDPTEALLEAE